jgi:putative sigma-54 modulation protein
LPATEEIDGTQTLPRCHSMTRHPRPARGSTDQKEAHMRIETYGHEIEVTPALREYVETKLKRLERHFEQPCEVRTQLGTRKPDYLAEATVNVAGRTLHADAGAQTMYAAIDILADKLDRLLVKHKEKRTDVQRHSMRGELIG